MGTIVPIVPSKIWFDTKYAKEVFGNIGPSGNYSMVGSLKDDGFTKIILSFGKDPGVTEGDKIGFQVVLQLIKELREGIVIERSEAELNVAEKALRKYAPIEALE